MMLSSNSNTILVTGGSGFIGTNLIATLKSEGVRVVNLDTAAPLDESQRDIWVQGDVRDLPGLQDVVSEYSPTHVVHLAARVDVTGQRLSEYSTNTVGTSNLLDALARHGGVGRLIVASTQFVGRPGHSPRSNDDYNPHTVYGVSKVEAEEVTRRSELPWTIVRPTTIWGPYDLAYRRTFYRTLDRGLYLHPGNVTCHRSLGYVGNLVHQVLEILNADESDVIGKTFYLGDPVINLIDFVDAFSLEITGKPARTVPANVIRFLAAGGTLLKAIGIPSPITLSRYRSMTEDYVVPLDETFPVTGQPQFTLEEGVEVTVSWLRATGVVSGA